MSVAGIELGAGASIALGEVLGHRAIGKVVAVSINSCISMRTASRTRSTPSPAQNASDRSDRTDWDAHVWRLAHLSAARRLSADTGKYFGAELKPVEDEDYEYMREAYQSIGVEDFTKFVGE